MEKILNFFKNKAIGYYLAAFVALFTLVLSIVFFISSKGTFPNSAAGIVTESIGIFLLVGAIIEIIFLMLPQYRFVHLISTFMYCLSFAVEVLVFAPLVAGKANNVEYEGGSFEYHLFYLIALVVILGICIAASFVGFFKSEDGVAEDMKVSFSNKLKLIVVAVSAVVIVGGIVGAKVVEAQLKKTKNIAEVVDDFDDPEPDYRADPLITEEIKAAADEKAYDFDPKSVIIKQQEKYEFDDAELRNLGYTGTRSGDHHLVYYFEGVYAEGYQGDYSPTYGEIFLWDDGLYGGKIKDQNIKGFWYNSSIRKGSRNGEDIKDQVVLVSNISRYESMICSKKQGFYNLSLYAYLDMGWGQRSMEMDGYYYYPDVATLIKYKSETENFVVGETLIKGDFATQHVMSNCKYGPVFKSGNVTWTWGSGMIDSNNIFIAAGEFTITSKWNGYTATKTITVKAAEEAAA